MKRLTKVLKCDDGNKLYDFSNEVVREVSDHSSRLELLFQKMAEYEDAEETGLIKKFSCRIGDVIWDNDFGFPMAYKITGMSLGKGNEFYELPASETDPIYYYSNEDESITGSFFESEIGKTIFLSREEAISKIKES